MAPPDRGQARRPQRAGEGGHLRIVEDGDFARADTTEERLRVGGEDVAVVPVFGRTERTAVAR